jgi:hypothetical protein
MLLFEHPVNVARETAGKRAVNSVWFEGGGTYPPRDPSPSIHTWANDATITALAAFAGNPARPMPESLATCLDHASSDQTLVVALEAPIDVDAVERAFAAPARSALERGAIEAVTIVADGDGGALSWRAQRPSLWSRMTGRFGDRDLARHLTVVEDR